MMRRPLRFQSWFLAGFLFFASSIQAAALNEYQIKAGFIYQFTKFMDWPLDHQPVPETFNICVLGDDPFEGVLDQLEGESVKELRVRVKNVSVRSADACQILFISASEEGHLSQILKSVRGKGTLTISEINGFLEKGGMIRFVMQANKIRFEISNQNTRAAGISVSSKLLQVASRVVNGESIR